MLDHASALAAKGELQLALHVIDVLATLQVQGPEIENARRLKAEWLRQRASQVRSYVAKSILHGCSGMLAQGPPAGFGVT